MGAQPQAHADMEHNAPVHQLAGANVAAAVAEGGARDAAAVHPLLDVAAAGPDDDEEVQEEEEGGEDDTIVHRSRSTRNAISGGHPRGVKPLGNLLFDGGVSIRAAGLGPLLSVLSDEQLLDFLKSYCDAADLLSLSRCSKALYIVANEEELWRGLALERWEGDFRFVSDWKNTYALMTQREAWRNKHLAGSSDASAAAAASAASSSSTAAAAATSVAPVPSLASDKRIPEFPLLPAPQRFSGYYSDFLFQAFYCSHIDLETSYGDATAGSSAPAATVGAGPGAQRPSATSTPLDTIARVHVSQLSPERFQREFGAPNRPLIIQGLMDSWPCYAPGPQQWNQQNWSRRFGSQSFKIGRYNMDLDSYFAYMNGVSSDESPLYLFDSKFGEKQPDLLREYEVPQYFANDFFELLRDGTSEGEKVRPAFRWILVGPARSGSTWHKDPNMTSAWNGLISGRKKWIMYPPEETPPGVFPSANQAEVCTPISVAEWFINYYGEHRGRIEAFEEKKKYEAERQQWHEQQKAKRAAAAAAAGSEQQEPESHPRASKKAKTATGAATATATAAAAAAASSSTAAPLPPAGPVECICEPGEVIFIPHGWWHTALNLTPSFAVTQNYVNADNVWTVCDFLATDEMEVERNTTLLAALETKLEQHHPDLAAMVEQKKVEKEIAAAEKAEAEARVNNKKKSSLWERLTS